MVYLDIIVINIEAQNCRNKENEIQKGRKHHRQMILPIEDKMLCNTKRLHPVNFLDLFFFQNIRHKQSGIKILRLHLVIALNGQCR